MLERPPTGDGGPEVDEALTARVGESLPPAVLGLAFLYVVFAVGHAFLLPRPVAGTMATLAGTTAVLLLGLRGLLQRRPLPRPAVYPVAMAVVALVLGNTLLHQHLLVDPLQATNLMLLLVGAGLLLHDGRWYALVVALTVGGWALVAAPMLPSPVWIHFGFAVFTSAIVGTILQVVHTRNLRRVETLLRSDELRARELELRVAERTFDLTSANRALQVEMATRARVEDQLRRSENYLRTVVDSVQDVITVVDVDGVIRYESPSTRAVLGFESGELVGRPAWELIHPDDIAAAIAELEHAARDPGHTGSLTFRLRDGHGEWRTIEAVGRKLEDTSQVEGFLITSRDVTLRVRFEEQQREVEKMEAVGQLAGGIAHDFNNLLTVITGHAKLLSLDVPEGDARHADVTEIIAAAERAAALTRQLLAVGRRQPLRPRVLDVNQLVDSAARTLRQGVRHDVEVVISLSPRSWPVRADGGQIEQALLRLAHNAQEAMPGGGTIRITTSAVSEPEHRMAIDFSDTGTGMDAVVRARIFEPFFSTRQQTGLGLSTVYGIVRQSGGTIEVESEPGAGATFRILLPVAESQSEPAPAPTGDGDGDAILLAEDEPSVRTLARRVLERNGFRVVETPNGEEALRAFEERAESFAMLITDVLMPGIGGAELANRLRQRAPQLPILFISGYTGDLVAGDGTAPLDGDFLPKPFSPEMLLVKVHEALRR